MKSKPELIVVSQNLLGGGSSFHRNMLANWPDDFFDIKTIYLNPLHWDAKRLDNLNVGANDVIFDFGEEDEFEISKRLNHLISNREGAIVANLPEELKSLSFFPKSNKTVYFICHDKGFLNLTQKYDYIIDVFIAHNLEIFEQIKLLLPNRVNDIYFIQHGVDLQDNLKVCIQEKELNLVFLARHVKIKGIYDLPKINQGLLNRNIKVQWTILGEGEESINFKNEVKDLGNFRFLVPKSSKDVINVLKEMDVFILPSSHDGLPVALLESMSVGCVPIVYNFSEGIKSVITEEIGFVVDLFNINGIVDKVEILHNDRNLLFEMAKNSILSVEKNFNIKVQAIKYFELYKKYQIVKSERNYSFHEMAKRLERNGFVNFLFKVYRFLKRKVH